MAPRLNLLGGSYKARSPIAGVQRCVNLYPEKNPPSSQSPAPITHYPRPGYRLLAEAAVLGLGRGLYTASNGALFKVVGTNVYYVDPNWQDTLIGTIALGKSIVSMDDNGVDILLVDGSTAGYSINLLSNVMTSVIDPAFYGADSVRYVGSCFALNRPGTPQFYVSGPNALTFDPLDFGQKTASPDPLVALAALNNQIWLLGSLKGEIWYFSGAADFPFQLLQGVLVDHGCAAKYSPAATDKFLFWLTRDKDGKPWVAKGGADYSVVRASTHAIEEKIQGFKVWDDAIGYTTQYLGHTVYVVNFPSADETIAYDLSTDFWHERVSIDINGRLHRDRGQLQAYAYNTNVALDWQTGALLEASPDVYTDVLSGTNIVFPCIRTFPHIVDSRQRIAYRSLSVEMEVGNQNADYDVPNPWSSGFSPGFGPLPQDGGSIPNPIFLRQSTDGGRTFRNARAKSLGATGKFKTQPRWWRLDMARDSVFELSWALNCKTALNSVFPDVADMAET